MRLLKIALAGAALAALASVGTPGRRPARGPWARSLLRPAAPRVLFVRAPAADLLPPIGDGSEANPFPSIADALRVAPAGAEVRVAAGEYRDRLAVVRSVSLIGAGAGRTRLTARSAGGAVIALLGAERLAVRGLSVEGGDIGIDIASARNVSLYDVALRGQAVAALRARHSGLEIESCEVIDVASGRTGAGLDIEGGTLEVRSSAFRRAGRRAMIVRAARATITDADVERSSLSALQATDGAEVSVVGGRFVDNGGAALYAGGSKLVIRGARLERNELGIVGFRGARLTVEGAQLYDHEVAGIALSGGSARISGCIVARGGSSAAILITESKSVLLENNSIYDPGSVGIQLTRSKATLRGNDIRGAQVDRQRDFGDAVYALESNVVFRGNVLHANAGSGIALSGSTSSLEHNDLLANGRAGVLVGQRSTLSAASNLFERNRGPGVEVSERSVANLRRNRFFNSASPGIQDFCRDPGLRGSVFVAEGNTFVDVGDRLSCL